MKTEISFLSRVCLALAGLALIGSLFVPVWKIDLQAPQYPEGLVLLIFANKLGGQVEIINGLNHYIGMATLHTEDFIEFTLLPYIIGFFAAWSIFLTYKGSKKRILLLLGAFIFFGIVAMVDFYRWEYNYGHNLDPNAAIIVPGMAYQPPLIGFKQLLNFGAFSFPDLGGWMFIGAGVLMIIAFVNEVKKKSKPLMKLSSFFLISMIFSSCHHPEPVPIQLNKDVCAYCQMTISDGRFGAELVTVKGRTYPFDDVQCLIEYKKEHKDQEVFASYVNDYSQKNILIKASDAVFITHPEIKSPMGGNFAAFSNAQSAESYIKKWNIQVLNWKDISK